MTLVNLRTNHADVAMLVQDEIVREDELATRHDRERVVASRPRKARYTVSRLDLCSCALGDAPTGAT